jgi:hypothetical protein
MLLLLVLASGLGGWAAWASQQPGGISGTINSWIEKTRGTVQEASVARDLKHATEHYNEQYQKLGVYPVLNETQLGDAEIGVGLGIVNCGSQGVVFHAVAQSRLLVAGENLGDVPGTVNCPDDLGDPAPWKRKN